MQLTMDLGEKKMFFKEVIMTTETKMEASKKLEVLIRKITNAITEARMISRVWTDIYQEVEDMRKTASAGKSYMSDKEKKTKFEKIFEYLNGTVEDWKVIKKLALTITNTFN